MDIKTEVAPIEVAKLVEDAIFQFEQRIEMLNDIVESEGYVVLASTDGDDKAMNDEQSAAFRAGVATAIRIIGKFPLTLDRPTSSFDVNSNIDD
ncbi:hypothetical protein SDC64_01195 [Acinetobacter haemolyticus]|uniref:hypothetical protein n=1 Tax=Acinetobacter haemolyticus TaxID=29430 RepID=UPI002A6ABBD5|nr:hypothetical protein [Acinetobacter haemolyticus]WPO67594.1 hypothetical protein SDC64_01195 [Acinetobacter haemolyticus]